MFEIRNYHFEPSRFSEYRNWAREHAVPYLRANLDIVGFWVKSTDEAEVGGAPLDGLGSANVTWIIRWDDLAQRNAVLPKVLSTDKWEEIFEKVPGGRESYRRTEAKFADEL